MITKSGVLPKVLVVATSEKTRGGITACVSVIKKSYLWDKFRCRWIETQIDRNLFLKVFYLVKSYLCFFVLAPFYDIIHFHSVPGNCIRLHYPLFRYAVLLDKRVIVHLHVGDQLLNYPEDKKLRYFLINATLIIALSFKAKGIIDDIYSPHAPVKVLYNAAPEVKLVKNTDKEKFILVAGILDKNKAYDVIIKAFALISDKFPDWRLVFAGNGDIDVAKGIALTKGVSERVDFPGWINGDSKVELFEKASVYCLASYVEGFPMSVLEAWSYGLPVICTTAGGLADVVSNRVNAMVFEAGNVEMLAALMSELLGDESLRSVVSQNSLSLVKEKFAPDLIFSQLESIYLDLYN